MAKMSLDFSEIKRLPITEVGREMFNLTPMRISSNSWSFEEHDSIRISIDQNIFNRFSVAHGGGSVIDFVIEMQKEYTGEILTPWHAAIKLSEYQKGGVVLGVYEQSKKREFKAVDTLPDQADNMKRLFGYLCRTRHIDYQIVKEMVKKQHLYQDTYGNCVFVGYFNGNPYYSTKIGTNPNLKTKFDVEGSFKEVGLYINNNSSTLKVFESPIDAMSYMSLRKIKQQPYNDVDYLLLSGASVLVSALNFNLQKRENEYNHIALCLDNDDVGMQNMEDALAFLKSNFPSMSYEIEVSELKDWNDDLKDIYNQTVISDKSTEDSSTEQIEGNIQM